MHLSSTYRKLSIASRGELTAALETDPADLPRERRRGERRGDQLTTTDTAGPRH
jgi:hypothetical protein